MTDTATTRTERAAALDAVVERTAALRRELALQHASVRIYTPHGRVDPDRSESEPEPEPAVEIEPALAGHDAWRIALEAILPMMGLVALLVAVLAWIG